MTTTEAIKELQTEHDLIVNERDLDGSQFAPALLEALAMAIEVLKCSEIPNCSEPKCADGCIYGWGSSECGHCDYRSEEPKTGDTISRKQAIDGKISIQRTNGVEMYSDEAVPVEYLKALPPAHPERERGYWAINPDGYYPYCSECRMEPKSGDMTDFCPNCGADMR